MQKKTYFVPIFDAKIWKKGPFVRGNPYFSHKNFVFVVFSYFFLTENIAKSWHEQRNVQLASISHIHHQQRSERTEERKIELQKTHSWTHIWCTACMHRVRTFHLFLISTANALHLYIQHVCWWPRERYGMHALSIMQRFECLNCCVESETKCMRTHTHTTGRNTEFVSKRNMDRKRWKGHWRAIVMPIDCVCVRVYSANV